MSAAGPFPRKKKAVKHRLKSSKPEFEHEEYEAASKANPEQTKQAEALAEQSPAEFWSQSLENSQGQPVENVGTLTDLDKLYMALAEVKKEHYFNTLCFGLGINSLNALENYSIGSDKAQSRIISSTDLADLKEELKKRRLFSFYQLAGKYKRSNVHETCRVKGIPVIQKQDVSVTKAMGVGPFAGYVCEAQWTRPDGVQQKVCLRYDEKVDTLFLHEAEMANVLRHKNMLSIYGVVTGSSYSPTFALVVEFAEYGNLYESRDFRTVEELCRFTIQAATALEYVESKGIIHQSVKSNTCLVVSKTEMKLGGLGSCQYDTEMKKNKPAYTQKDVVYQFAKLFSVHFTGFNYKVRVTDENVASSFKASAGRHGYACPSHFRDVFNSCMQENPEARPSFKEIRESLLAQKFPSKVRVTTTFIAVSPDFIGFKTGELITLIAKDRHKEDKTVWLGERQDRKIGFFKSEHVKEVLGYHIMDDSFVPPEIRARGPEAELAFQKALQNGKVKVYRGRIMLLGQDRAGKTSLKKSLLGIPFNPQEESTVGVEVDPSKCQVDVDQIKNWEPIKDKKLEVSEFAEDIAMLIAKDLSKGQADKQDISQSAGVLEESNRDELDGIRPKQSETLSTVAESTTNIKPESTSELHGSRDDNAEGKSSSSSSDQGVPLNIDTTAALSDDVTELVIQYLERLKLDDDIKAKEVILTLWDFAGQHLYYASHPVFLSPRAVYVLVYNLSKSLSAEAEPCVRQGIHDLLLDNPNSETNLDSLLAWLVSVHSIRRPTESKTVQGADHQGTNLPYLRPPVFIVGTNADHPFEDHKKMEKCIERGISGNTYEEHVIRPFFAVDNTKSQSDDGIQKLQKKIMEVLKREPYMGEEVPIRWFNFEKVVEALVATKTFHMSVDHLLTVTRRVCQIEDDAELTAMLNFYHDLGVIVKHGHTVVLQAQWLINLFKQLITVPPFNEVDPVFSKCWRELEENGILRMALVDHVFTDFIQSGLSKQDVLDMMELYGLIGKFSCLSSTNDQVQQYFVPAQVKSSSSGLCKISPSDSDPCPLYIYFSDGFVPHGLFSQLLSRSISWCSQQGLKQPPQLYNNGARLFIGMQSAFELLLICRKRFIKIVLKMSQRCRSMNGSTTAASTRMANEVRAFLEMSLKVLTSELFWFQSIQYELRVACCLCSKNGHQCTKHKSTSCSQDECLHLLRVHPEEEPICTKSYSGGAVKVNGLEKWFQVHTAQNEEETLECPSKANEILNDFASLKCGKPSTDDLLLIAYDLGFLGSSWKMFGHALHLDKPQLGQIEEDEGKLIEKSYGMLKKWLESCGDTATYQSLAEAFQQVRRTDLAAKYCNVHSDPCNDYVVLPSSPSVKAGTPSSEDLLDIAGEFCASWKMFCRALHLTEATLAQIEENEGDMVSKCHAVLRIWTEKRGSEATYERLAQALQHPAIKLSNLAAKYCHLNKSTS